VTSDWILGVIIIIIIVVIFSYPRL